MTGRRQALAVLDRLVRVRRVRSRQALAALGRVQARAQAEAALGERVAALLGRSVVEPGPVSAIAAKARAAGDAMLATLAFDAAARLGVTRAEQQRLAQELAAARAAVDAAVDRRAERERGA